MAKRFERLGRPVAEVMAALDAMRSQDLDWRGGRVPLYVFSGPSEVSALGQAAFDAFFSENALGAARAFPSLGRMEREVIEMGLDLFSGPEGAAGNMTSGGTESILMAVKACRDRSRAQRGRPDFRGNIVLPFSAHPAFDKAAALMDLELRRVAVTPALVADPAAMADAADADTIMLVGSVPCFSYGTIDPIAALSDLALERGIWLHVDACVGGWLAPFVAELGRPIPPFDFSLPGVSSLSADLHKFGFCPKPASTIFYRSGALRQHQTFDFDSWPSGRFATQTLVGTRPGGAVAAAWAILSYLGRDGYRAIADQLMALRDAYREGLIQIPGMRLRGAPALANLAFGCDDIPMSAVAGRLAQRGWLPGQVREPPSLHLMLSLHHAAALPAYLRDVGACVAAVRAEGGEEAEIRYS